MISTEVFRQFTGTEFDATIDEMLSALDALTDSAEDAEVGSALLCSMMRKTYNWGNAAMSFNHPRLVKSAITRHIERGNVLLQCDEFSLVSSLQSVVPLSSERLIKMNAECMAITTGAKDISDYVRWTCAAEVVAKTMQVASDSATCAQFVARLKELGIHHPVQIRQSIPAIAAGLAVPMPKRAGAATSSTDGQATTAPTIVKVDEAITAWTADRVAGGEAGAPFEMRPDEIKTAEAIILRVVRQLLAAGHASVVEAILPQIEEAIADQKAKQEAEPLAKVTRRMNRDKFSDA